jgi:hypothetical protein
MVELVMLEMRSPATLLWYTKGVGPDTSELDITSSSEPLRDICRMVLSAMMALSIVTRDRPAEVRKDWMARSPQRVMTVGPPSPATGPALAAVPPMVSVFSVATAPPEAAVPPHWMAKRPQLLRTELVILRWMPSVAVYPEASTMPSRPVPSGVPRERSR